MSEDVSIFKRIVRPLVTNDVATGRSEWYPELGPRRYEASVDEVLGAVEEVVRNRERWSVVNVEPEENRLEAEVETEKMGYVDDLTVRLETEGSETVVHARSVSRVGVGDMGQNARTIRELLDRLDDAVGAANRA